MIRKRLVSLFLAVVMLCSLSMTAFAASDEDVAMSAEQGIIASETFEIPVSLSLDELDEMKSELEECGIPYTVQGNRAIATVNVTTNIHYVDELYFSIIAQCRTTLLQKITGSIVWKYKTTGSYSKTKTISVNYQDDLGITCTNKVPFYFFLFTIIKAPNRKINGKKVGNSNNIYDIATLSQWFVYFIHSF